MKAKILFIIIFIECLIIFQLGTNIHTQKNQDKLRISLIEKESILFSSDGELPIFYEPKPNTSIVRKPNWLGYTIVNTTNSDSLNERFEYTIEKPRDILRIITLGDSFTYGAFVNTKENWPEQLEDMLNSLGCSNIKKFEVINLGFSGYDIAYSVERFRVKGRKYNPDMILWLLHMNDFIDLREITMPKIREAEKEAANKAGIKNFNTLREKDLARALSIDKQIRADLKEKFGEEYILAYQKSHLYKIREYYKDRLVLISFPNLKNTHKDILKEFVEKDPASYYFEDLINIRRSEDVLPDGHPSVEGHSKIARDILNYLVQNQLISCHIQS